MTVQEKSSVVQMENGSSEGGDRALHRLEKPTTVNGDIGLNVFEDVATLGEDIDPQLEKMLVRKIDMFITPFICITYLITYIDKATLSYGIEAFTSVTFTPC
jgi:hypothetical protein